MYRRLHNQFGTAGLILSVVAIVLALAGGAIAANSGKPGPRGKTGKTGKTGPQGVQGLPGANGTNGAPGANGKDGTNGTDGTDGLSASTESFSGSAHAPCTEGGVVVKSASPDAVLCNGKKGTAGAGVTSAPIPPGPTEPCGEAGGVEYVSGGGTEVQNVCNGSDGKDGEPGVIHPGETLPPGASETGIAGFSGLPGPAFGGAFELGSAPISFPIPLATPIESAHVIAPGTPAESDPAGCEGTIQAPEALEGNLCIFVSEQENVSEALPVPLDGTAAPGAGKTGTEVFLFPKEAGALGFQAVWVVTAH